MAETNGNGFPLSMKVAYAKDLLVAKVADSPERAVDIVKMLITALADVGPAPRQDEAPQQTHQDDTPNAEGPVMERARIKNVTVKTGNGQRGPWTKYGVLCEFTGGTEKWLNTFDTKNGSLAEKNKGKYVLTSWSQGKPYNGKPTFNLDSLTELANQNT